MPPGSGAAYRGPVISFDMACTLFWEPGCEKGSPRTTLDRSLEAVLRLLRGKGLELGIDPRRLAEKYLEEACRIRGMGPRRELWHKYILLKTLRRLGVRVNHVLLEELYRAFIERRASYFTMPGDARRLVELLHGSGYTLVLTTATWAHDLALRILEINNASGYFSLVYSTQLVGIPKSDPSFYRELSDLLGVEPSSIIHIGDSVEQDIRPARRAGLKTIYYGWRTGCRPGDPSPCATSYLDILAEIRRLEGEDGEKP